MAVTIQTIADKVGVSRGTVDRAINQRGKVKPELADEIARIALELGYEQKPRKARVAKKDIKIGIVTQLSNSSFMKEINKGIAQAHAELQEKNIEVILNKGLYVDENEQLSLLDNLLQQNISDLAIMPVESEKIREKLLWISEEKKIPVITFNSDMLGVRRVCFVGMDNHKSGRTAAGLLGLLTKGQGKILIITGYFSNQVNNQRVAGFTEEVKRSFPQLEVEGVHGSFDDAQEVEKIVINTLHSHPDIAGILVVSGGQKGLKVAFEKLQLETRPYVIIYDQTTNNEQMINEDFADFLINQNGFVQGYQPAMLLAKLLLKNKKPHEEFLYTDIIIKNKYNLV